MKERLSSKVIPAIYARMLALNRFKTLGFSSKYLDIFLDSAVCAFRSATQVFDDLVSPGSSGNLVDKTWLLNYLNERVNWIRVMKQTLAYRVLRWVYHEARYRVVELPHRLSAAWSQWIGVTREKREPELIVSLTTIPERIGKVHLCLDSLLRQSLKPDRLILWLSKSNRTNNFNISRDNLPNKLAKLQKRGLEIRWCTDIGSYRKIIPTIKAYPDAVVVTADDDVFYPKSWLEGLYFAYRKAPHYIHCHRAHLMNFDHRGKLLPYRQWDYEAPGYQGPSLRLFPTGVGGVLYAPGHLHAEVLDENAFLKLCPKADDVWLKAMSLLNKVSCKKVTALSLKIFDIRITGNRTLSSVNFEQDMNDPQIEAVCSEYLEIRRIFEKLKMNLD